MSGCDRNETLMSSVIIGLCMTLCVAALTAQTASPAIGGERLSSAARELVRSWNSPEMIDDMCSERATALSSFLQVVEQRALKRDLSDDEKQRLYLFVYRKLKELMDYRILDDQLVPILSKHLTLAEIEQINEFYRTPAGRKLVALMPVMARETKAASENMARKMAEKKWLENLGAELKRELPSLFPEGRKNE